MTNLIAIQVENVLRKTNGGAPIPQGLDLYFGLATRAKIVLLTEAREKEFAGEELRSWLETEGLYEHIDIQYHRGLYYDTSFFDQLGRIVGKPSLVVTPSPDAAASLIHEGYSTLLFSHAEYADPAWRPDAQFEVRPWDNLAQQVAAEAYLKARDDRNKDAA